MKNIIILLACFVLIGLVGCGEPTVNRAEAIEVQGQVNSADGKALSNVTLCIQPVSGNGFPVNVNLDANGSFKTKIIPGKYVYYFQPIESGNLAAKSKVAIKNVAPELKQPKAENTVEINSPSLTITLK